MYTIINGKWNFGNVNDKLELEKITLFLKKRRKIDFLPQRPHKKANNLAKHNHQFNFSNRP